MNRMNPVLYRMELLDSRICNDNQVNCVKCNFHSNVEFYYNLSANIDFKLINEPLNGIKMSSEQREFIHKKKVEKNRTHIQIISLIFTYQNAVSE